MKKLGAIILVLLIIGLLALVVFRAYTTHSNGSDLGLFPNITPAPVVTPPPAMVPTPTPVPTPEPTPTPMPTPTPTPDPYLHAEAGNHMLIFKDEETNDYFEYWVYVPENAVKGLPLMIFLHGDGYINATEYLEENGLAAATKEIYGENFPYILLAPCTRAPSWENGTIPQTLIDLINYIIDEYQCDRSKVMLTGHSRGAIGTWWIASEWSDMFSCIVPLSCPNDLVLNFDNLKNIPVRAFVGSGWDDYDRYGISMTSIVNKINEKGGDAELTILHGLYHGDTEDHAYTPELLEWMLKQ